MLVVSGIKHSEEMSLSGINLSELFEESGENSATQISYTQISPDDASMPLNDPQTFYENMEIEYIESSQNFQGNYHNYVFKVLKSILPLKKLNYSAMLESGKVSLPDLEDDRKTLILDLDETLIHSDFDGAFLNHDSIINFKYGEEEVDVPLFIRPGLQDFLQKASEKFEILVFTASVQEYADAVLNHLDPENKFFPHRFYRNNCICVGGKVFIKDLRIFTNRKPQNLIMVDNSLYSFTNQISNGVLINSFYNDKEDRELYNLLNYLENYLHLIQDVRSVNEKVFNFNSIIDEFDLSSCKESKSDCQSDDCLDSEGYNTGTSESGDTP